MHRAGVQPDDLHRWTAAGVGRDNFNRIVFLASGNVTYTDLQTYPSSVDDRTLISFRRVGITAVEAHEWGHAFGWCCQYPPVGLPPAWAAIIGWRDRATPAEAAVKVLDGAQTPGQVTDLLVWRAPARVLRLAAEQNRTTRNVWMDWVAAADGHVNIAYAVCQAGGNLSDVTAWLATGETIDRIAMLVKVGANPQVLDDPQAHELTDTDLEVWAALTEAFPV